MFVGEVIHLLEIDICPLGNINQAVGDKSVVEVV